MAQFFDGKEPDEATLKRLIRKAVITGAFYPVLCGSAFKNKGVQTLLDAVVDYLPSPLDVPPIKGIDPRTGVELVRRSADDEPLAMLAFKIMDDPFVGSLTFCRIYSGKLETGMGLLNSPRDRKERVGRMLLMHANHREDIKEAYAGDIIALAGLKEARTGDTLCDPQKPVILEKMEFPDPVIEVAVEPKTKGDQEKLGVALSRLAAEDPSFRVSTDPESGQTILKGMGELHLDIKVDILKRTYKVDVTVGAPQVAYRETITKSVTHAYTHKKQSGGSGQFAHVELEVKPSGVGQGNHFEARIVGGTVPKEYIPGVEKGVEFGSDVGRPHRFPGRGRLGGAGRRQVPRRRLVGARLRNRRARRIPRGAENGGRGSPRADHEGRGGEPRGVSRVGHRRHQLAAWPDPGHRYARQCADRQRDGAARQHVRLRQYAPLDEPGARVVHDAVRSLRTGTPGRGAGGPGEVRLTTSEIEQELGKTESPDGKREVLADESRTATLGRSATSIMARRH